MTFSTYALILGVCAYLVGFPLLLAEKETLAWLKKYLKDDIACRFTGSILVVVSALLLRHQWYLTPDAEGLVVLIAWLSLLKGLAMTWWMKGFNSFAMGFLTPSMGLIGGLCAVVWGALLTYLGLVLI
jgi:hypothetical protein